MSKNLESEYQNMIRAEVPDIWDKIEAKIDAQEAQKKVVPFKKKTSRWKYYVIPAAAALLCVAIAVPVLFNAGSAKNSATATATSTAGGATSAHVEYTDEAPAACDNAVYEDAMESADDQDNKTVNSSQQNFSHSIAGNNKRDKDTETFSITGDLSFIIPGTGNASTTVAEEAESDDMTDNDAQAAGEDIKGTVFTLISGGGIPRQLIEKAVQALGLKISEYDAKENLYRIVSDYELDEDTVKEIMKKIMESGFVKEIRLGE